MNSPANIGNETPFFGNERPFLADFSSPREMQFSFPVKFAPPDRSFPSPFPKIAFSFPLSHREATETVSGKCEVVSQRDVSFLGLVSQIMFLRDETTLAEANFSVPHYTSLVPWRVPWRVPNQFGRLYSSF